MNRQDPWQRLLASLHDDALWPAASELIDEAVGIKGNALLVGSSPKDGAQVY